MKYEVIIEKHWEGKKYNVRLISWQGNEGLSFGKSFNVSKRAAEKEAQENSKLYNAKIIRRY